MSFYRMLCLILVAYIIFGRFSFPFRRYPGNASLKMFPLKRPAWVDVLTLITFIITALAWQRTLTYSVPNAWIITIIVSGAFIKVLFWMLFYRSFRKLALWLFAGGKRIVLLNISCLVGICALVLMAFLLY